MPEIGSHRLCISMGVTGSVRQWPAPVFCRNDSHTRNCLLDRCSEILKQLSANMIKIHTMAKTMPKSQSNQGRVHLAEYMNVL